MRHWLIALINAGLTLLLGLGLIRAAAWWPLMRFSPSSLLRLQRFVTLAALAKGSFYLLQGTSAQSAGHFPVAFGLQFPDPVELMGLAPMTSVTIWNPTAATHLVTWLLNAVAACFFLFRTRQMFASQKTLAIWSQISHHPAQEDLNALLHQVATGMGFTAKAQLPRVIVADLACPTPLLLGLWRPYILFTPKVLAALSSDEIKLAFRHELAHFRRHDHWWRWVIAWVEDAGRLNILTAWLGAHAQVLEEELCDRMAVRSAKDAVVLASAITKASGITTASWSRSLHEGTCKAAALSASAAEKPKLVFLPQAMNWNQSERHSPQEELQESLPLPHAVVPFLSGRHTQKWKYAPLLERLSVLLRLAQELSDQAGSDQAESDPPSLMHSDMVPHCGLEGILRVIWLRLCRSPILRWINYLLFGLSLFLICYAKFQLLIGRF